jgi:hypothetical protein
MVRFPRRRHDTDARPVAKSPVDEPISAPQAIAHILILAGKVGKVVWTGAEEGTGAMAAAGIWKGLQRCPKCGKPKWRCKCNDAKGKGTKPKKRKGK